MAAPGADFWITAVSAYKMVDGAVERYERLHTDWRMRRLLPCAQAQHGPHYGVDPTVVSPAAIWR
jgi:hypothetical protein